MNRLHLLTLAAGLCLLPACIINADSHTTRSGKYISTDTVQRIEPGKNADYVIAVLGEPSSRQALADGTEIWKWTYRERKRSSGAIFLVVDSDSTTETERATYVELQHGVVVRAWQD